jgi:hypothetical protein
MKRRKIENRWKFSWKNGYERKCKILWEVSVLLSFIVPICQALPNRTTWHLNADDYLQEIGVADLH